ncbi:MAG: hypothetical protein ACFFBD_03395 [Candidatus Hodarchaeota archaeon]
MLFQSSVPQLFQSMNLAYNSSLVQARKMESALRLNMYHDSQLERLEEQLNELFSDPSSMVKVTLNIVKKIVNNLSQTYREAPTRTLENGSEKDQALYSKILEESAFDIKMKQASRYTKLLKTILIRPIWRNERIDIDILTGNIIDVVTGDTPEELIKVLVTNYGTSDRIEDVTYSLWSEDSWTRLDYRGNIIEQKENPYQKAVPFLPCFDYSPPSSAFWLPGGDDIISMQEAINLKLTDLLYLIQNQSFGVGYLKGSQGGGSLKVDPGSLIELGENGEIGFVSQKAEIKEVVNAIDKIMKWACVSNGLSASSMSTDPKAQSGISKAWDSKELGEQRLDDISLWRSYEKKLFTLMRIVYNTHSPKKLSESATLKIDFAEVEAKISPKEQAAADDLKIAQGVLSPVDIAMRENPDLTSREDALSFLIKIKEELRTLET